MGILTNSQPGFWNTKNVTNMSDCFQGCTSLTSIPHDLFDNWERRQIMKERGLKLNKIYEKIRNRYNN